MKLKRFEALSLHEALNAVKAELGPDAVIVSSRRIQKGGGLFGLMSQSVVEVTAAVDRNPTQDKVFPKPEQALEALVAKQLAQDTVSVRSQTPARPLTAQLETPSPTSTPSQSFSDQLKVATALDPVTQHLKEMREDLQRLREEQHDPERVLGPLRQELEGLKIVVGEALSNQMQKRMQGLPADVMPLYQSLVGQEIAPSLAHGLIRSVVETLGTAGLTNPEVVEELLWERLEDQVTVAGHERDGTYGRKIKMLVGPTGVGKTTTIAKLAGLARERDTNGKTVLVTLDTYRVAAVEQLRVFAKILKIPLEVAVSPEDFHDCLGRHQDADLILVDTAGRSPRDRAGHDELVAMTRIPEKIETHLVLAAPMAESILTDVVHRYQALPIHKMIITKLDEAQQFGGVFNVLSQTGFPVSYLSAGQRVPEDLSIATKRDLVELVWKKSEGVRLDAGTLTEVTT